MAAIGSGTGHTQRISTILSGNAWQDSADVTIQVDGTAVYTGQMPEPSALGWSETIDLGSYDASTTHDITIETDASGPGSALDATPAIQVQNILVNGASTSQSAQLPSTGTANFEVAAAPQQAAAAPTELGAGSETIHIQASEDAWQGDAQMVVFVDGTQVGSAINVTALHAAGAVKDILINGDWGTGQHTVTAAFVNDAWGGTTDTDRNLYVQDITLDHTDLGGAATLDREGRTSVTGSFVDQPAANPAPATGSTDQLVLTLSEDAFQGDAQFTVSVDGVQIGGVQSVTASHGAGGSQAFGFAAAMTLGQHQVSVSFLNDLWDPGLGDRNLYVDAIMVNGAAVPGAAATMYSSGQAAFDIDQTSAASRIGTFRCRYAVDDRPTGAEPV